MHALRKAARTLVHDRAEFSDLLLSRWDRTIDARSDPRPTQVDAQDFEAVLEMLSTTLEADLAARLDEPELLQIEDEIAARNASLGADSPFPLSFNASPHLARLCYALCRELAPRTALETGVANGATSAYLLQALAVNGDGRLLSIDWTPQDRLTEPGVGVLVPERLRGRWELRNGTSRRLLSRAAGDLGEVGLFVSDAVHTYRAVRRELQTVAGSLTRPAAVLTDDIEGHCAFEDWARTNTAARWAVGRARGDNAFGVAIVG